MSIGKSGRARSGRPTAASKGLPEVTEGVEKDTPIQQVAPPLEDSIDEEKLANEVDESRKILAESVKAIHEWYAAEMENMSDSESDYDDTYVYI